jgi:hypothetical protein
LIRFRQVAMQNAGTRRFWLGCHGEPVAFDFSLIEASKTVQKVFSGIVVDSAVTSVILRTDDR